jgi:hypothetical protein
LFFGERFPDRILLDEGECPLGGDAGAIVARFATEVGVDAVEPDGRSTEGVAAGGCVGEACVEVGYGYQPALALVYMTNAVPMLRRLDMHLTIWACCRALFSAGKRMAIRIAMIPMTTSSSTSVKPVFRDRVNRILDLPISAPGTRR